MIQTSDTTKASELEINAWEVCRTVDKIPPGFRDWAGWSQLWKTDPNTTYTRLQTLTKRGLFERKNLSQITLRGALRNRAFWRMLPPKKSSRK